MLWNVATTLIEVKSKELSEQIKNKQKNKNQNENEPKKTK